MHKATATHPGSERHLHTTGVSHFEPFFHEIDNRSSIPNGTHVFAIPKLTESGAMVSEGTRGS